MKVQPDGLLIVVIGHIFFFIVCETTSIFFVNFTFPDVLPSAELHVFGRGIQKTNKEPTLRG